MSESIFNVNPSSMICRPNLRLNEQITFTCRQIESLLKLQVSTMKPQECLTLVASKLKLLNIEENCIHAWLADKLSSVVRNIQLSRFSLQQGVVIVRWIVHYMSLVIEHFKKLRICLKTVNCITAHKLYKWIYGVEKLSKVTLFEKLRMGIIVALENAGDNMIPLPNSTECTMSFVSTTRSNKAKQSNADADDSNKPSAIQIAAIIANTLHEIFWDDFKYTVVQMAFNTDPMEKIKILNTIKDLDPLHLLNDSDDLQIENSDDEENECHDVRMCAIMDRYFIREPNNPSLAFDRLIKSLKESMCRRRKLYVLDKDNNDESVRSTKNFKNVKIQQ